MRDTTIDRQLLIRTGRRKDIPELLRIDNAAFPQPWDYDEFVESVWKPSHRTSHCIVAELCGQVVAYCVFTLYPDKLEIRSLAVSPEYQRLGIGTVLVARLKRRLDLRRRSVICLMTSEKNLDSQLFWKAVGFRASAVVPNAYETTDEDGYVFKHSILWKH